MDMSSMSSSSDSMDMSMGSPMTMIFFTSTTTPLFSARWSPTGTGSYAGTCIFLIILAVVLRLLMFSKHVMEQRWMDRERNRSYIVVQGKPTEEQVINKDPDSKTGTLITERGSEESVRIVRRNVRGVMPWRISTDLPRAALVTLMAGVSYLL